MGASQCSLCECNNFTVRAVFGMDACHLFPHCMLPIIPLIGGVTGVVVTRASGISSLLCDCHSPSRGRFDSPVVGVQDPRFPSELYCEVGGTGALLLGEEPLSTPSQELSIRKCTLVSPVTCCVGSQRTILLALPSSHLNCGNADIWPWCLSDTTFTKPPVQMCRYRSTEVVCQNRSNANTTLFQLL